MTIRTSRAQRPVPSLADPVLPALWLGVDTHQQTHHAALCDAGGGVVADREFPATRAGYETLVSWAQRHGRVVAAGVESTSSYGAGLTRHLRAVGVVVHEINSPDLAVRAGQGKSDAIDAVMAARAVIAGRALVVPKDTTGTIEAIRMLKPGTGRSRPAPPRWASCVTWPPPPRTTCVSGCCH